MLKILSPCGILGYGFPDESLNNAIELGVDAIIVDAGSTDAGPHKLAENVSIVSKVSLENDMRRIIKASRKMNIPLIIGSSGGSGTDKNVDDTHTLIKDILISEQMEAKINLIYTQISTELVKEKNKQNKINPLSDNTENLTDDMIDSMLNIVGQISHDNIVTALENDADIIICGRTYDPAIFAGFVKYKGYDLALGYHLGKILECGAICCVPGSARDCVVASLDDDNFTIQSMNPERKCTVKSVAAHTFYEKNHPYILHGPGTILNLENTIFEQVGELVKVSGSTIEEVSNTTKIEGASLIGYRTFVIAAICDEVLINQLEKVEDEVLKQVQHSYKYEYQKDYQVQFINYGLNALKCHSQTIPSQEVCVVIDVLAETQEIANSVCASLRSTFLHFGFENRRSTSGNLAFPFAPSDIAAGPVYKFSGYHLVDMNEEEFVKIVEVDNET